MLMRFQELLELDYLNLQAFGNQTGLNRIFSNALNRFFCRSNYRPPTPTRAVAKMFVGAFLTVTTAIQASTDDSSMIENSVIKIYTTQAAPDYFTPWRLLYLGNQVDQGQ